MAPVYRCFSWAKVNIYPFIYFWSMLSSQVLHTVQSRFKIVPCLILVHVYFFRGVYAFLRGYLCYIQKPRGFAAVMKLLLCLLQSVFVSAFLLLPLAY